MNSFVFNDAGEDDLDVGDNRPHDEFDEDDFKSAFLDEENGEVYEGG